MLPCLVLQALSDLIVTYIAASASDTGYVRSAYALNKTEIVYMRI